MKTGTGLMREAKIAVDTVLPGRGVVFGTSFVCNDGPQRRTLAKTVALFASTRQMPCRAVVPSDA